MSDFNKTIECYISAPSLCTFMITEQREQMRELQNNIKTVVQNWWENVKDKVTLYGLYYHYNGNSHDDDWEFEYYIADDGGPFRGHFDGIKEYRSTYDVCRKIKKTPQELMTQANTNITGYVHYYCSINDVPVIITPIRRVMCHEHHCGYMVFKLCFQENVDTKNKMWQCINALGLTHIHYGDYRFECGN